ncbi:unnamed protein product [Orchesella dallaii]|uniref:Uncharacterized protein n=1 Tax=Orchesella dallaii TaxID=48710 RepID=A0ABP1PV24_9HEXA
MVFPFKFWFGVAFTLFIFLPTITVCFHKTPVSVHSECVINFVTENDTITPPLPTNANFSAGYIVQDVSHLLLSFTHDIIDERNLSITDGYFRFYSRFKQSCFVYLLFTVTFNGTTTAIANSGYGTSESTLFLINSKSDDDIITGFQQENLLFASDTTPFYAPIGFVIDTNLLLGFCYHCPSDSKFFVIHQVNNGSEILLDDVIASINIANSQGYGKRMELVSYSAEFVQANKYLENHKEHTGRKALYSAMREYVMQELFFFNLLLNKLNTTMLVTFRSPENHAPYSEWFLQVRFAEGGFLQMENEYAITRGKVLIVDTMPAQFVVCDLADNLSSFDFMGIVEIIDVYTWICILLTVLAYTAIYKDIMLGIDLMWPFFGIEFCYCHNPKIIWTYLILISYISYTYQSFISSDSLRLSDISPLHDLAENGYRVWVRMASNIIGGKSASIQEAYTMSPENYRVSLAKVFPGKNLIEMLYDGHPDLKEKLLEQDLNDALEIISKEKLLMPYGFIPALWAAMEHYFMYVKNTYLCKSFDFGEILPFQLQYTYRMWSSLSSTLASMQRNWIEVGIFDRERNFWMMTQWEKYRHYDLQRADSFLMPHAMRLKSIIGVACLCHCALTTVILIINVLIHVCSGKKKFAINIGKLRKIDRVDGWIILRNLKFWSVKTVAVELNRVVKLDGGVVNTIK